MRQCVTVFVVALLLAATGASQPAAPPARFDLLIRNGRVLDGTGNPFVVTDIGVREGRIAGIGRLASAPASRIVDATGLYVVPGFIDMHSHGGPANHDVTLRSEHNSVAQGITTAVLNPDGGFMWPIAEHVAQYRRDGLGVNAVMMVGHNKIRELAMGYEQRPATDAELEKMRRLLQEGLVAGAYGLTLGLEGTPGRWSDTRELVELAKLVAARDGFISSHQRAEGRSPRWWNASRSGRPVDAIEATLESIQMAEQSGARVSATHFKVLGKDLWGAAPAILRLVDEARGRGVPIYLDTYTYESYGNTATVALVPQWALVADDVDIGGQDGGLARRHERPYRFGNERLQRRLADPAQAYKIRRDIELEIVKAGGADGVLIIEHPVADYVGKRLAEIAARYNQDPVDAAIRLQMEGHAEVPGGGSYRGLNIHDDDNEAIIRKSYVAYCTDGGAVPFATGFPHPRYYGIYPRILRKFVLDRGTIDLPFAIRAMTSLPAAIIGLKDRGALREGSWADITLFDPLTLRDNATYLKPHVYPTGIRYVFVNGVAAVDEGKLTGAVAGKMLTP